MMCRLLFLAMFLLLLSVGQSLAVEPVFPGANWQNKPPAEVGMDAAKLQAFSDFTAGRGCVTRYGYMVYTWGDATRRGDVASAAKPFVSHFLFKALEAGKIPSLDEKVVKYEPRLANINAALEHKDKDITWRHLATQTSCYQVADKPGSAYCYNDWQLSLFWDLLFLKVYGVEYGTADEQVLRPMLTDPIGCQDHPTMMAFGIHDRAGRVAISPRDFCRFGLLYRHQGRWNDIQILKERYAVMAISSPLRADLPRAGRRLAEVLPGQRSAGSLRKPDNQTDHRGSYSFLWWVNGVDKKGQRLWPGVPDDAYGAFGHGGRRAMVVIPSLELVTSWNDTRLQDWNDVGGALKRLVKSVRVGQPTASTQATTTRTIIGKPLAGQIIVDPSNPAWLVRYRPDGRHRPFFMCGPGDPEGFLYRGKLKADGTRDGDQRKLIDELKPTSANCIYMIAVRSHGGDGDNTQNPFVDHNPAKGLNTKVLDQWETWFTAMDEAGIVIYLFLYDDSTILWQTGDVVGPQERQFIHGLVNRFKHHRHLIWSIAEEYQERFSAKHVSAIAAEIRAADEHVHPIAVSKLNGLDFSELADDPNIDQFAVQYNVPTASELHTGMVKVFRQAAGRYNLNMGECADMGTGGELRRKMWAAAMGGAYVMVVGMDIATSTKADLEACGRMVHFFESTSMNQMAPHDELAAGGTQYVLGDPGRSYIAYSGRHNGKLGLKSLPAGTYKIAWLDCATGKTVREKFRALKTGEYVWNVPEGLGAEVAIYVR